MAEMRSPYGSGRYPQGNMRYSAMGMNRPERSQSHTVPPPPERPPEAVRSAVPSEFRLNEEMLMLIAVAILLSKSGADWPVLAALIYIMM